MAAPPEPNRFHKIRGRVPAGSALAGETILPYWLCWAFSAANDTLGAELVWLDRSGKSLGPASPGRGVFTHLRLSPDQKRVAVARADPQLGAISGGWSSRAAFPRALTRPSKRIRLGLRTGTASRGPWFEMDRATCIRRWLSGDGQDEPLLKSGPLKYLRDWSRMGVTCSIRLPRVGLTTCGRRRSKETASRCPSLQSTFHKRPGAILAGRAVARLHFERVRHFASLCAAVPARRRRSPWRVRGQVADLDGSRRAAALAARW